jgi:hypothetical protein
LFICALCFCHGIIQQQAGNFRRGYLHRILIVSFCLPDPVSDVRVMIGLVAIVPRPEFLAYIRGCRLHMVLADLGGLCERYQQRDFRFVGYHIGAI